jgi:signal transduction histidine kinase
MNLRVTIGLLLFAAVLLPMVVSVALVLGALTEPPEDGRDAELARMTARLLRRELVGAVQTLDLGTELFDLPALPAEAATGVLRMLYKQDPDLTVVALLDSQDQAVVEPVFLRNDQVDRSRSDIRLPVDETDLGRFLQRLPIAAARAGQRAFSDVYADQRRNTVLIAGALAVPAGPDRVPYLLAFERSLRQVQKSVAASIQGIGSSRIFVVDGGGRLLAHPDGNLALQRTSLAQHPLVARLLAGERAGQGVFDASAPEADQPTHLSGAFERLDFQDWAVVVERQREDHSALAIWSLIVWLVVALAVGFGGWRVLHVVRVGQDEVNQLRDTYERRAEDLQKVQASLLETRKLNAIGDLGAGVAHEFNNPLGGILGLTQLLLRRKSEGDPDLQFLRRIEAEAKRCKAITDNLLRFSEQQGSQHREPIRVDRVLDKAVDLIDSRLDHERVRIQRRYHSDLPRVVGNEGELQRAFLNVLLNAETAMPEGGQLTLSTAVEDESVVVRISDTGRGISKENLPRVFEPFFTTKDNWKGAGLGLWVVYQIVQEHESVVAVESEEGVGTTFSFRFPCAKAGAQQAGSAVPLA